MDDNYFGLKAPFLLCLENINWDTDYMDFMEFRVPYFGDRFCFIFHCRRGRIVWLVYIFQSKTN